MSEHCGVNKMHFHHQKSHTGRILRRLEERLGPEKTFFKFYRSREVCNAKFTFQFPYCFQLLEFIENSLCFSSGSSEDHILTLLMLLMLH